MLEAVCTRFDNRARAATAKPALPAVQADALARLLKTVGDTGYRFITPTPLTHQRVLDHRGSAAAATLRDIFGWSLPFDAAVLPPDLLALMNQAGVLATRGTLLVSTVRISSIDDDVFLHTSYPTVQEDAVFFGPDTYRFARFIQQAVQTGGSSHAGQRTFRVLDVGCGSGAGGVVAARALARSSPHAVLELTMNDINPLALRYASANAACSSLPVVLAEGDALSAVTGQFDLIISNPPYLDDASERAYRHGGARLGRALSVRIAEEALGRLAPGGQLLLYTGVAIVDGVDAFRAEILPLLEQSGCLWSYAEIDPDVFGEELEQPVYAHVDRIAAVALVATRPAGES
jgi:methylase of polypeptide subunit release factors